MVAANQPFAVLQNRLFGLYDTGRWQPAIIRTQTHGTARQRRPHAQLQRHIGLNINGIVEPARKQIVMIRHRCAAR